MSSLFQSLAFRRVPRCKVRRFFRDCQNFFEVFFRGVLFGSSRPAFVSYSKRVAKLGSFFETAKTFLKFFFEASPLKFQSCIVSYSKRVAKLEVLFETAKTFLKFFFVPRRPEPLDLLVKSRDHRRLARVPCPVLSESDCKGRGFFVTCNRGARKTFWTPRENAHTGVIFRSVKG